jgi:hypothetical protein
MKNTRRDNLLKDAAEVVYNRNTEKTQEYGPFDESMASAALIASELTGKQITTIDFYKCMMALKLARLKYSMKDDTILDLLAYTGQMHKSLEDNKSPIDKKIDELKSIKYEQVRESL